MTAAWVAGLRAQQGSLGSTAGEGAAIASNKGHSQVGQDLPSLPVLLVHQVLAFCPLGVCTPCCNGPR